MGYIYLVTNQLNGMKYIGQTKHDDINKRWREHKNLKKSSIGRFLLNAYEKYGIDKFKFQIVCICFDEDCNKYETEYITKFNTLSPNGYNLKAGGHFSAHHPETKKLMSESIKKIWTPERKKLVGDKLKQYYKSHKKVISEEQKQKIRDTYKRKSIDASINNSASIKRVYKPHGRKPTEKSLQNLKSGFMKKSVGKYTLDGILLETYSSISEASRETNISLSTISKVCLNKPRYKTAGGFIWKYV